MGIVQKGINFVSRQEKPFRVNLVRATIHLFLQNLVRQYQPLYILRLGASPLQLGLVNSIGGIAITAIAPPTGWLADRFGIRRLFLLGTPVMILGALIFAFAPDWTVTIPALLLVLLAQQVLLQTACPMVCGSYLKNEERATGRQLCDMIASIPSLAAPMIAATVIARFGGIGVEGIRPLFYIQAIGFLLSFVWVYELYVDTLKKKVQTSPGFIMDIREVFERGTAVKRWLVGRYLFGTTMFVSMIYVPTFIAEVKQGDEFVIGSVATASLVTPLLLAIIFGRLADTFGRKKALYISTFFYCLSVLTLIYARDVTMLVVSGFLQGFLMLSMNTSGALSQELIPVSLLGRWTGIQNVFRGLASISGPVIAGLIWSIIGPEYVFFFIILVQCAYLVIIITMPETLQMIQPID